MSTISKETADTVGTQIAESAASQLGKQSQSSSSGQIHSDAVSLEVPLKVHGSKVIEAARGVPARTEPFEEQASSMIVFPNGGVLRMATVVSAGQMLVLTNIKSRQDAICRVVKVRNYSGSSSYVEVEFTHRQLGFWGVYFESDDASIGAAPAATSGGKDASATNQKQTSAGAPPTPSVPGQSSAFIGIGSREDVQPAASTTSAPHSSAKIRAAIPDLKTAKNPSSTTISQPPIAVAKAPASHAAFSSHTARTQQEEEDASIASEGLDEDSTAIAAAGKATSETRSDDEVFGSRLGSATQDQQAPGVPTNWLLIAACGAGLFLVAGGAMLLSHHKSSNAPAAQVQPPAPLPVVPAQPVEAPTQQVSVTPSAVRPNPAPPVSARETSAPTRPVREAPVVTESPAPEPSAPAASSKTTVPSVFGALNAHPVPSRLLSTGVTAPSLDTTPAAPIDPLQGITAPSGPGPLPASGSKPSPSASAVPVGGSVRQPRVLSTAIPEYPAMAKQTRTQGDVVLQIVVDKSGNVTDPKVVSGPVALRAAAIDAVRRWKYEPSTLDGQPVPVQILVTIQFRL